MDIEVRRDDMRQARVVDVGAALTAPERGAAVFRIDSFALTANNVTYGTVGDLVGYWRFYPASEPDWGRIPVWGHAEVVMSEVDGVEPGQRYFGYWPMSTHTELRPVGTDQVGFVDGSPHRADLPVFYNRYRRSGQETDPGREAREALLSPLFATSFLIDAWLGDEEVFGATTVVLSSASSKTALGLAYLLSANRRAETVGLTAAGNVDFVKSTGVYDRVVSYDELRADAGTLGDVDAVFVDFAGSRDVLRSVHEHFADRLRRSVTVGITHEHSLDLAPPAAAGPAPELFFAPDHGQRRAAEWGAAGLAARIDAARSAFEAGPGAGLDIVWRHGVDEVLRSWVDVVDGRLDPRHALICMWE